MRIAKQTNTQLHDWDEKQQIYNTDGTLLSPAEAAEYGALIWDDGLIASAFNYSRTNTASIPANESLLDYFRKEVKSLFTDLDEGAAEAKRETLLHITEFWGAYVGSPVSRQSLKYFWLEECIEGENPFVAGTYMKILEHVAKAALEKADIRLKTKVATIISRGEDGRERPGVTVEGGEVEEFDEVVVTSPLGWLKRNKSAFVPGMTDDMVKAVDSLGYGSLDKVYITFPEAFWEKNQEQHQPFNPEPARTAGLDAKKTTPNVTATTQPLHQAPSHSKPSTYPGFTHWISPLYAPSNPHHWDFEAMNLSALPGDSSHPTLLFYIYGPSASHIGKLISSHRSLSPALDAALLDFFYPYYSRLPNHSDSDPACTPKAVLATNWVSDEMAGYGSYCNFQVGLERGDWCVETLRRGMPEVGVWFAGEHTAPFVALGTSTGAWWSGEGVARRIVGKDVAEGV